MRRLLKFSAGLAMAVSVAHTLVAVSTFDRLSAAALWFLAAGLLLPCSALLNLATWLPPHRHARPLRAAVHGLNVLLVGFAGAAAWVLGPGPGYAVLLAMVGFLVAGAGLDRRSVSADAPVASP